MFFKFVGHMLPCVLAMIGVLWDQWWAAWKSRNKDLHGADAVQAPRAQAETQEVHSCMTKESKLILTFVILCIGN